VLEAAGQRMIRRVQCMHDGSLVLITDNTAYLTDKVDTESMAKIAVIGRVVWAGGTV
jgi:phage repressor protein C with HTH and peptisase S24 domain